MEILKYIPETIIDLYGGKEIRHAANIPTLFGEHLLDEYPTKVVGLTRREDACLMLATVYPNMVWCAVGKLFVEDALQCLHRRKVLVFALKDCDLFQQYIESHDLKSNWTIMQPGSGFFLTAYWDMRCFGGAVPKPTKSQVSAMRKQYGIPSEGYGEFYALVEQIGYTEAYYKTYEQFLDSLPTIPQMEVTEPTLPLQRATTTEPYSDGVLAFDSIADETNYINGILY